MKASELILLLQSHMDSYGDAEVVFAQYSQFNGPLEEYEPVEDVTHEEADGKPVIVLWDE